MEEKQTAVEWLVKQCFPIMENTPPLDNIIKQAKQMEKEQICHAYLEGLSSILEHRDEEEYYNETYDK